MKKERINIGKLSSASLAENETENRRSDIGRFGAEGSKTSTTPSLMGRNIAASKYVHPHWKS